MPFIDTKTNVTVSEEQELSLKTKLGRAIEMIPGKSEAYLMLSIQDGCRMYFGGKAEPMAYLEVKLFGTASDSAYDKLTSEITKVVSEEIGVPPSKIYIKYEEISHWGWNGSNF